jgi:hypothetical protein
MVPPAGTAPASRLYNSAAFVKALAFDDTHRLLAVCDKNPQIHKEDVFSTSMIL